MAKSAAPVASISGKGPSIVAAQGVSSQKSLNSMVDTKKEKLPGRNFQKNSNLFVCDALIHFIL